ncbi:MAG TPA: type I DNA topoisomerase [Candidatus Babeliales bacterium]|nr:type I DNA topoisomerase [Candidatus Babeliales bacterium]
MKKLLIVESPAKIKTISKFLGKEFRIMSTIGHIKDLPPKRTGVTINGSIEIDYEVIEDKDKVIADICKEAAKCDEIYLAPDPDREGEIIAWHIGQEIAKVAKKGAAIYRITFNEITKPAITDAIDHPSTIDMQKVAAQQARRVLDRWVGYEVSPILWSKIAKGLSAGRVQSVALRLICDRELEIRAFKPEEYWTIDGTFGHKGGQFNASLTHKNKKKIDIKSEKESKKIVEQLEKDSYIVESITDKERTRQPLAPFMTSTLQQAAYNRLGFSVKKTMQVAQNLYEGIALEDASTPVALITYMRTDSLRISDTALKQARTYIDDTFGGTYLPSKSNVFVKGKAQDAHEAVRPIDVNVTPEYVRKFVSADQAALYELIWKRFIACQMKPAIYAQRQVVVQGKEFTFKVTGSTLIFDGFLKVYMEEEEEDDQKKVFIPKELKEKDPVDLKKVLPKQHFTQPPARYTEASLVKGLEKEGIGRPSTYATILNTIRAREYTELDTKKRFLPTELGMTVTKLLTENLPNIMDTKFTALMEEDLDRIAKGKLERDLLLREFYKSFEKDLALFKEQTAGKRHAEPTDITCPECKKHKLSIRVGKTGSFLGCMGYPECKYTANFKRTEDGTIQIIEQEAPKLLDEMCPNCGKPLRQMSGKFGPFVACSGYPECKYIKQTKANFKCPLDKGDVVKKIWQGKPFWGCGNYPKCKFVVFGDIEETPCPKCKLPFLVKKIDKQGNVTLICSDKNCGYKAE